MRKLLTTLAVSLVASAAHAGPRPLPTSDKSKKLSRGRTR